MTGAIAGLNTAETARRLGRPLTALDMDLLLAIEDGALKGASETSEDPGPGPDAEEINLDD